MTPAPATTVEKVAKFGELADHYEAAKANWTDHLKGLKA